MLDAALVLAETFASGTTFLVVWGAFSVIFVYGCCRFRGTR